jgi:hypothetical protein
MSKDTGGPAFPVHEVWDEDKTDIGWIGGGMTLRDWFAGQVLMAFVSSDGAQYHGATEEHAIMAYKQADAMIAERNKP